MLCIEKFVSIRYTKEAMKEQIRSTLAPQTSFVSTSVSTGHVRVIQTNHAPSLPIEAASQIAPPQPRVVSFESLPS